MSSSQHPHSTPETTLDPAFVFDFRSLDEPDRADQRWSTWWDADPSTRGPEPRPDWVITDRGAIDTDLGVLKTGKEADVFLLERSLDDGPSVVMAAKRYRDHEHRTFHRNAGYTEGRKIRDSREARAVATGSTFGRSVAAVQWAHAEWESLRTCWLIGLPVPYPVQLVGTELLMEWITHDGETAPRLSQVRPSPELLAEYFRQLREVLVTMAAHGIVHGDLSAYNILAAGEQLVVIDLPQAVDLIGNPNGTDFLLRDCVNICRWFRAKGLDPELADEHALFADVLATAL